MRLAYAFVDIGLKALASVMEKNVALIVELELWAHYAGWSEVNLMPGYCALGSILYCPVTLGYCWLEVSRRSQAVVQDT